MKECLLQMRLNILMVLILLFLAVPLIAQSSDESIGGLSEADTVMMEPQEPPPIPAELDKVKDSPNDHGHSIDLTWTLSPEDDSSGMKIVGYQIWRGEKKDGEIVYTMRLQVPGGVSSYTDRGGKKGERDPMPNGLDYWYKIKTIGVGDVSSESAEFGPVQTTGQWYHRGKNPVFIACFLFANLTVLFIVLGGGPFDITGFIIIPILAFLILIILTFIGQFMPDSSMLIALLLTIPISIFLIGVPAFILIGGVGYIIGYIIYKIKKGDIKLYVRPIAGINAVDEAIGRATEMGKPILYVLGIGSAADIATICSFTILGRVAKKVAEHQSGLTVPCLDPIVMTVAQEIVKNSYAEAGRPDSYDENIVFFVTQDQFSYVAAVNGQMLRDKPASNFYLGYFAAESLLLAETGSLAGSIQIAGTDQVAQLPFFIVACDYTLIGEELYAGSAYLSQEPLLLGALKAEDWGKAIFIVLAIIGVVAAVVGWQQFIDWFSVTL